MNEEHHRWSASTKRLIAIIILILGALLIYRFQQIISPLTIAFLLAFILDPIVDFLTQHLRLPRGLVATLVFLLLILGGLALIATPVAIVPSTQDIVYAIQALTTELIVQIGDFFEQPLVIGDYVWDLSGIYEELSATIRSYVGSVVQGTIQIARSLAQGAFWLIFILISAFYLVKDIDRIQEQLDKLAPPGYREDFIRLRKHIGDVWHAFLRGQLLLGFILTVATTVILSAIGVPYAWVMSIFAGLMAFIPNIGPLIAAIPPILVAFIYGSNFLPISNLWFGLLVGILYLVIQLIYNNILGPRIMGRSLHLHPLLVLIAVIVGGQMAGILGMLLAAPILATLRILIHYILSRLYDRDPFARLEEERGKQSTKTDRIKQLRHIALCYLNKRKEEKRQT